MSHGCSLVVVLARACFVPQAQTSSGAIASPRALITCHGKLGVPGAVSVSAIIAASHAP